MTDRTCRCGAPLGPRAATCRNCRRRVQRRLDAGLPVDAYPAGGRRGRLPLSQPTGAEQQALEHAGALARTTAAAHEHGRVEGIKDALLTILRAREHGRLDDLLAELAARLAHGPNAHRRQPPLPPPVASIRLSPNPNSPRNLSPSEARRPPLTSPQRPSAAHRATPVA